MACSVFLPLSTLLSFLLTFRSVLSAPATPGAGSLSLSQPFKSNPGQNTTGWTWFYVSSNGSQILPISGPQGKPASNLLNPSASNGHSYTFGFANDHGPATPRPGLAKFLFDCEFGLFDATPASGLGVWTPWPRGKYLCNGNLPGQLLMTLLSNTIDYKMAIRDLAFFNKVLHDTRGVEDSAPFFDFVFNYTPELDTIPYERVVEGRWKNHSHGKIWLDPRWEHVPDQKYEFLALSEAKSSEISRIERPAGGDESDASEWDAYHVNLISHTNADTPAERTALEVIL